MTEEIYGDVLFIINFSMDFLSLYMAGRLMHLDLKAWRVMLGASIGALYGVLELVLSLHPIAEPMMTLGVLLLMCLVAFGAKKARTFLACAVLTGASGMLIGGIMTAAFVRLGKYTAYIEIGGDIHTVFGDLPIYLFVVLAAASAVATFLIGKLFRKKSAVRTCGLRLSFSGQERELTALVDSGNLLEEPLSGTPVIFLKKEAASVLPEALLLAMKSGVASLSVSDAGKLRVIPGRTVSGEGILLAAVPESLFLSFDGAWEPRRALVAVDFTEGDYGGFEALVPEILF